MRNDYNEITGIPFNGDFQIYEKMSEKHANNILKPKLNNKCCLNIKIKINECEINNDLIK